MQNILPSNRGDVLFIIEIKLFKVKYIYTKYYFDN